MKPHTGMGRYLPIAALLAALLCGGIILSARYDSWLVLVILLLLILLGVGYPRLASRRSAHIERLVIKRAAEMHKAN